MRGRFSSSLFVFLVHVFGGKAAWGGVASVCGWVDGSRMMEAFLLLYFVFFLLSFECFSSCNLLMILILVLTADAPLLFSLP